MKDDYRLWTGHLIGLLIVVLGVWWIIAHISSMPDYKLVVALAAVIGFVVNHFRWQKLGKRLDDLDARKSINALVVSNYLVLLLVLVIVDLRR